MHIFKAFSKLVLYNLIIILIICFIQYGCIDHTCNDYKSIIDLTDSFKTVTVLHCESDWSPPNDIEIWLKFQIGENHLSDLLSANGYKKKVSRTYSISQSFDWFKPEKEGMNMSYYEIYNYLYFHTEVDTNGNFISDSIYNTNIDKWEKLPKYEGKIVFKKDSTRANPTWRLWVESDSSTCYLYYIKL
jgi:hypothetical protein